MSINSKIRTYNVDVAEDSVKDSLFSEILDNLDMVVSYEEVEEEQ